MKEIITLLRPRQWAKNSLIFAPLVFSGLLLSPDSVLDSGLAFVVFCFLASGLYVFNDLGDIESDKNHPIKKNRPLAKGSIAPRWATIFGIALFLVGGLLALQIGYSFSIVGLLYVSMTLAYSKWLKHIVLLDLLIVSLGFVLRAYAGAVALRVDFSPWLLLTTLFLALFLVLGKRRHELVILGDSASKHRSTLGEYSQVMLDQLIVVVATSSLFGFAMYSLWPTTVEKFGTTNMAYTLPIAVYGLFRYFYLIYKKNSGGDPSETLYSDGPLLLSVLVWATLVAAIIYA